MRRRLILNVLYILLTAKFAVCQSFNINFLKLGYNQGLNSINIKSIVKDKYGFIWVGTQDGIFKHTGKAFQQIKGDPYSLNLLGNDVTDMKFDSSCNTLWVSFSYGGINGIDIVTNKIRYSARIVDHITGINSWIKCIQPVSDSEIWIGTARGIISYNPVRNVDVPLFADNLIPGDTSSNPVSTILPVKSGRYLLFIDGKGIVSINRSTSRKPRFTSFSNIFPGRIDAINHALYDPKTNLCWLSSYGGLFCFDAETLHRNGYPIRNLPQDEKSFFSEITYSVEIDGSGSLWVCNRKGVFKLDLRNGRLLSVKSAENRQESVWETAGNVIKIFMGEVWIGTWTGLYAGSIHPSPFNSVYYDSQSHIRLEHIYHAFAFDTLNIYLCGEKGLFSYNNQTNRIDAIDTKDYYSYICKIKKGYLISKLQGLFFCPDLSLKHSCSAAARLPEFQEAKGFVIGSAADCDDGNKVLGSDNAKGVLIWNEKTGRVRPVNAHTLPLQLKEDIVNEVFIDNKKNVIILGDNYISVLDRTLTRLHSYQIRDRFTGWPYGLFFDITQADSLYFIATYGHGVLITDTNFRLVKIADVNAGLSNNSVYRLINHQGEIWASTNFGINRIRLHPFSVESYFQENGLHSNICEEYSALQLKNGLAFGGIYGFTLIDPASIRTNSTPPALYFTDFQVDENRNGKIQHLDTTNLLMEKFSVGHNWMQAKITFTALNYLNPERVMYQYRIPEKDTSWVNNGSQNFIALIGLNPGKYTLEIKAANEDGYWSPVKKVILIFSQKWYQTWLFTLSIVLATTGLLYAFYRYRISQIRKQQQIRKEVASDLHDDIGSSLNTVKIFAHLAKKAAEKDTLLSEIENSLTAATAGLRDMIWVLDDSQDTVFGLMERIKKFALPLLNASNIDLQTKVESDNKELLSKREKRNLYLIAKESLNNCVKYAGCKRVILQLIQTRGRITFSLDDDGAGFDPTSPVEGNGIKNIYERAKQIHYHAEITSSSGNGAHIRLVKKGVFQ